MIHPQQTTVNGAQGYHLRTNYALSSATSAGGTRRMFRDPKQSGGGVSTAFVNDPSNGATMIAGQQKKLSGFSVGGNYIAKKQSSN